MKKAMWALGVLVSVSLPSAFAEQLADDYGTSSSSNYCPSLSITMERGARDFSYKNQVSDLQRFFSDYYDIDPEEIVTGFFGRITQGYVQRFQREQGLPSYGIAGSLTRAAIQKVCQKTNGNGSSVSNSVSKNPTTSVTDTTSADKIVGSILIPAMQGKSFLFGSSINFSWFTSTGDHRILSTNSNPLEPIYAGFFLQNTKTGQKVLLAKGLHKMGGSTSVVLSSTDGTTQLSSGEYKIFGYLYDNTGKELISGHSDTFSVSVSQPTNTEPSITAISPVQGSKLALGSDVTIQWSSLDSTGYKVAIYLDKGTAECTSMGCALLVSKAVELSVNGSFVWRVGDVNNSDGVTTLATGSYTLRVVLYNPSAGGVPVTKAMIPVTIVSGDTPSSSTSPVLRVVGAYESTASKHNFCYSEPGRVTVNVPAGSRPVVLALNAYEPIRWEVNVAPGATLQKVILSGYNPQLAEIKGSDTTVVERYFALSKGGTSSVNGSFYDTRVITDFPIVYSSASSCASVNKTPEESRRYYALSNDYFYAYQQSGSEYQNLVSRLKTTTGLNVESFQGGYSISSITLPN